MAKRKSTVLGVEAPPARITPRAVVLAVLIVGLPALAVAALLDLAYVLLRAS